MYIYIYIYIYKYIKKEFFCFLEPVSLKFISPISTCYKTN